MGIPKTKFWNKMKIDYYKSIFNNAEEYLEMRGIKITKKIKNIFLNGKKKMIKIIQKIFLYPLLWILWIIRVIQLLLSWIIVTFILVIQKITSNKDRQIEIEKTVRGIVWT